MGIFSKPLDFLKNVSFFHSPFQINFFLNQIPESLSFSFLDNLLIISALFSIVLLIFYAFLRLFLVKSKLKQKYVLFEIKPLTKTLQSPLSTQQLFNLIHGLVKQRSFFYKLMDHCKNYAFEIVSTKKEGIRYLLRINQEDAELIKKSLLAYLPGISINPVSDYLPKKLKNCQLKVVSFKQANRFAYPLKKQKMQISNPV